MFNFISEAVLLGCYAAIVIGSSVVCACHGRGKRLAVVVARGAQNRGQEPQHFLQPDWNWFIVGEAVVKMKDEDRHCYR